MYVSDFAYSAPANYWNIGLGNYSEASEYNWLSNSTDSWTISRASNTDNNVFLVDRRVLLYYSYASNYNSDIKPTFYLDSEVIYLSGSGTQSDPYRIGI